MDLSVIIVEQRADLKWTVTCDEHGAIGNGQTTSEYALDRALEHQAHRSFDVIVYKCGPLYLLRKSGGKWRAFAPKQVCVWGEMEAQRSTRRLIEKAIRD
jgi:hypothetical protein